MAYFYKENPVLEAQVDRYFARLVEYSDTYCDGKLSILLLGSLSRGEGTWQPTDKGARFLSDIEYFTVYPDGFDGLDAFTDYAKEVQREVFVDQDSSLFHIDNTFVRRESLPRMERKLLTYDAARMGKTVVGEDCVPLLPAITVENIEIYPTHLRMNLLEDEANTARLEGLEFSILINGGKRFGPISEGIVSTATQEDPRRLSYRTDSPYFEDARTITVSITKAEFTEKDRERCHLNLLTGEMDFIPRGSPSSLPASSAAPGRWSSWWKRPKNTTM